MKNFFPLIPLLCALIFTCCTEDSGRKHDYLADAREIADGLIEILPEEDLKWDWSPSLFLYSLMELDRASGAERYSGYCAKYIDSYSEKITGGGIKINTSDSVAPFAVAASLDAAGYSELFNFADDYLDNTAGRSPEGAIYHWNNGLYAEQVWVDSLFMIGNYWLARHKAGGGAEWLDRFSGLYSAVAGHNRSSEQDLFYHVYKNATGERLPSTECFWLRGNGWAMVSAAAYLALACPGHKACGGIAEIFKAQINAALKYSGPDGLLSTIINLPDNPDNYPEVSGTALAGYALCAAINSGHLDSSYREQAEKIYKGIRNNIIDGTSGIPEIHNCSHATLGGECPYYMQVPLASYETFGLLDRHALMVGTGAVILFLCEYEKMMNGGAD